MPAGALLFHLKSRCTNSRVFYCPRCPAALESWRSLTMRDIHLSLYGDEAFIIGGPSWGFFLHGGF